MTGMQLFGFITLIVTFAVVVGCTILYAIILRRRHFKCPYCGARFKAPPVKAFFSAHQGADRLMICPECGGSGYMRFSHDGEEGEEPAPEEIEAGEEDTKDTEEKEDLKTAGREKE